MCALQAYIQNYNRGSKKLEVFLFLKSDFNESERKYDFKRNETILFIKQSSIINVWNSAMQKQTLTTKKISIFWDKTSCESQRTFRRNISLPLQIRRGFHARNQHEVGSNIPEDISLHSSSCKNLKSRIIVFSSHFHKLTKTFVWCLCESH
jgi:hypothetical protein